ncbi:MAG: ABC transporter permease [Planctomycetes bacterium]|nr:ABC transporter permease [Planctomycetota bacterium]
MNLLADLWHILWSVETLTGTIRLSIPLLLAALGGVFSERSGVVNIALEGIMLNAAFATVLATHALTHPAVGEVPGGPFADPDLLVFGMWSGVAAGMAAGVLTALIHAVVTVTAKADQIVSGVGVNLLAIGSTQFLCFKFFGSTSNSPTIPAIRPWDLGDFGQSFLGQVLFGYSPLVYLAFGVLALAHVVLFRTTFGLRLQAVGEHPRAADTLGVSVGRMRYAGVLLSGALAGLGGAYLTSDVAQFTQNMTAGRGYIALAAMILGKWTPGGALGACLLFAFAQKFQFALRGAPSPLLQSIPSQFTDMIPYLLTILVLAGLVGRARAPAALGKPYEASEA